MGDLLIRGLSRNAHETLKRRAEDSGMSLQAYVARILENSASTPPLGEWLDRLEDLPRHPELSGEETIRAARDELP